MVIDVSHVAYWGTAMTTSAVASGIVALAGIALWWHGVKTKTDFVMLGVLVFIGSAAFGSVVTAAIGAEGYEARVHDAKKLALLQEYDTVVLNEDSFVASKEGAFVEGFLLDEGEGRFLVMEAK